MEQTEKPTIDPESPSVKSRNREKEFYKRIPKYEGRDYQKMYYVMKKYRTRQSELLENTYTEPDYSDPDPFDPSYIFYCFQGTLED